MDSASFSLGRVRDCEAGSEGEMESRRAKTEWSCSRLAGGAAVAEEKEAEEEDEDEEAVAMALRVTGFAEVAKE